MNIIAPFEKCEVTASERNFNRLRLGLLETGAVETEKKECALPFSAQVKVLTGLDDAKTNFKRSKTGESLVTRRLSDAFFVLLDDFNVRTGE